jgi:hypothetical protein
VSGAAVVQPISGLTAETAYRYEAIATNSESPAGGTVGPLRSFTTQAFGGAPLLADARGWEMVSPVDKNGGQIRGPGTIAGGGVFQAAAGGGAITYSSVASFGPEAQGAPRASQYLSARGEAGWSTENITAPALSGSYGAEPEGVPYQLFSPDLATSLLLDGRRCGDGEPCPVGFSLRDASGALAPSPEAPGLHFEGADPELHHVVLSTCAKLTADATEISEVGGSCNPAETNLYEWSAGGLTLINAAADHHARLAASSGAISTDGDRVYFTAGEDSPIFLREAGRPLTSIANTIGGVGAFQTASADGSLAFYTVGGSLYRYDAPSEAIGGPLATEVDGVLGASADGSHVYYASAQGLFLWDEGMTTELAPGGSAALASDYPPATGTARASPDGGHLAFLSSAQLSDYENRGDSEVYLYSAGSGALTCVSCNPTGERPRGPSSIPGGVSNGTGPDATRAYKPRVLTADGNRLFFDSEDVLAVADTDARPDVYEWEAGGSGTCARPAGCVNLISSGKAAGGASFLDASEDGSDAFFLTDGSLVLTDPGSTDVYDARVGGGFPVSSEPISCEGDSCQSLPSEPDDPSPGTLVRGSANPPAPRAAKKKKPKKHHKKRHHTRKHQGRKHRGGHSKKNRSAS